MGICLQSERCQMSAGFTLPNLLFTAKAQWCISETKREGIANILFSLTIKHFLTNQRKKL